MFIYYYYLAFTEESSMAFVLSKKLTKYAEDLKTVHTIVVENPSSPDKRTVALKPSDRFHLREVST